MPCPYFQPAGQLIWPSAPKLPLGDPYAGLCRADAASEIEPGIAELKDCATSAMLAGDAPAFRRLTVPTPYGFGDASRRGHHSRQLGS